MINLSKYLTESITKNWWVAYEDLFNEGNNAFDIAKSMGVKVGKPEDVKIIHSGSNRSIHFAVKYKNTAGVWMRSEFKLPDPSGIPCVGVNASHTNKFANDLIEKNKKKLPKLEFDSCGNVRC